MKNKYFILVLTFLSLLIGQSSYAQDWQDMGFDDATNDFIQDFEDQGGTVDYYDNYDDYADAMNNDDDPYNDVDYGDDNNYNDHNDSNDSHDNGNTGVVVWVDPESGILMKYDGQGHTFADMPPFNDGIFQNNEVVHYDPNWKSNTSGNSDGSENHNDNQNQNHNDNDDDDDDNDDDTDIYDGLLDPYNYGHDNDPYYPYDDDQYPPGDTPNNNDTGTPEEPTKPEDCPTANCSKTQKIKAGTCDCEQKEKNWYLDNDGDGYDSGTYTAEKSPGSKWKEGTSKGVDCDDSRYSDTNTCADIDPCAEIKKQLADTNFKDMIADLKDPEKLKLNYETGYYQDKAGSYKPMEVFAGQPGVFVPYGSGGYQNTNHVHTNQFIDASGVVNKVFPMPSPRDIATIYTDYNMSRQIGTDPGNNYTGTINSLGYFQLRYTGQSDNLPFDQLKGKRDLIDTQENWDKFKELATNLDYGQIEAFLLFMRDILKITDIALYKVDDTGAKKLELDANNQVKEIACN